MKVFVTFFSGNRRPQSDRVMRNLFWGESSPELRVFLVFFPLSSTKDLLTGDLAENSSSHLQLAVEHPSAPFVFLYSILYFVMSEVQ
jgi:hypothetical protein